MTPVVNAPRIDAVASHLGVPEGITARPPTPDTDPASQTHQQSFFSRPLERLDLLAYGSEPDHLARELAEALGGSLHQAERASPDLTTESRPTDLVWHPPPTAHPWPRQPTRGRSQLA